MKEYSVEITRDALLDMESIYEYIGQQLLSPENAIAQFNRIADSILKLNTFPERFKILESKHENELNLRRMVVDNYSVFYVVNNEKVIVTNVLYNGTNIEEKLQQP